MSSKKIIGEIISLKEGIVKKLEEAGKKISLLILDKDDNNTSIVNQELSEEIIEDGLALNDIVQVASGADGIFLQVVKART